MELMMKSLILFKRSTSEQGFAVLASTVLLSTAAIVFTLNMASSQLVDNQIMANYYRNNEAFANAQSGINFVLAQLNDPTLAQIMVTDLPFEYTSPAHHYRVMIREIHARKFAISAYGTSIDGTAKREINFEIDFYLNYPIPNAAVSSNGKINLDDSALVNDGCEGLTKEGCRAAGNIANNMLVTNPYIEVDDDLCSGGSIGTNIIADGVLQGHSESKVIELITDEGGETSFAWGAMSIAEDSAVGGLASDSQKQAGSLFEATFGIKMSQSNLDDFWDSAVKIDMNSGGYCSELLHEVTDENEIIFIKGDCDISQYYAEQSKTSENKVFTIGTVEHPKLVFIEGGTFFTAPNTGIAVVGMLYFLPGKHDFIDQDKNPLALDGQLLSEGQEIIQVEDVSIDMGGINVTGALLSEYKCSHDGSDKRAKMATKQHFSARFDKLVLEKLYSLIGMQATGSGYRLVTGTWRDF